MNLRRKLLDIVSKSGVQTFTQMDLEIPASDVFQPAENLDFVSDESLYLPHFSFGEALRESAQQSSSCTFFVAYISEQGCDFIDELLCDLPSLRITLAIGAITGDSFPFIEELVQKHSHSSRFRVLCHLGYSFNDRKLPKVHPVAHQKLYRFEMENRVRVFIGSHNLTAFALEGRNSEMSTKIEFSSDQDLLNPVSKHLSVMLKECSDFDVLLKEKYIEHTFESDHFIGGLKRKFPGDRNYEYADIILCELACNYDANDQKVREPVLDEIIVVQVPAEIKNLSKFNSKVTVFVYPKGALPRAPSPPGEKLPDGAKVFTATVVLIDKEGDPDRELSTTAHWCILDSRSPELIASVDNRYEARESDSLARFRKIGLRLGAQDNSKQSRFMLIEDYKGDQYQPMFGRVVDFDGVPIEPELFFVAGFNLVRNVKILEGRSHGGISPRTGSYFFRCLRILGGNRQSGSRS